MWKYYITNNFAPEYTVLVLNHTTEVWNPIKACFSFTAQKIALTAYFGNIEYCEQRIIFLIHDTILNNMMFRIDLDIMGK